jgi:hypothetical protein
VFLAVCSPYVDYIHRVTGRWALSGKQGITMGIAWAYAQGSQAEHDRATASLDRSGKEIVWLSSEQYDFSLVGWIQEDPERFLRLLRHNLRTFVAALFEADLFQPWQIILIALGLFAVPWSRRRAAREGFLFCAIAPTLSLIGLFVLSRFMAIVVPFGMIWAAEGYEVMRNWASETGQLISEGGRTLANRLLQGTAKLLLPAMVVLLLLECASVAVHERPGQPFYRLEAAAWLAQHAPAGSAAMLRDSEIALYANLRQVALPNAPWDAARAYGRARGAEYVILDDKEIRSIRPDLAPVLDTTSAEPLPGVTPLARLDAGGRTMLIFALR